MQVMDGTGATKHHMCMLVKSSLQLQNVNVLHVCNDMHILFLTVLLNVLYVGGCREGDFPSFPPIH